MCPMVERALTRVLVAALLGIGASEVARAGEPGQPPAAPTVILNLVNRPRESQEEAFSKALKADALAPVPSGIDLWEPQADGSMRNKKTGLTIIVRNPCPPGDIEHEFALSAYNRALARSKSRR